MAQYTVIISDEEEKALLTDMVSIQDWLDNAVHNKARQCVDVVCRQALEDESDTLLTKGEKGQIVAALAKEGRVISTIKHMPPEIKGQIVALARVKSVAERQAEVEKGLRY